jgi:hypothetical protein
MSVAECHWEMVVSRQDEGAWLTVPAPSRTSFWLDGGAWELPGPDNADVFVERLVRAGLLVHDPVVTAALNSEVDKRSTR